MLYTFFKKNYLFDLPNDIKQVIKKMKEELDNEIVNLQNKIDVVIDPDVFGFVSISVANILSGFKYMNNEKFEKINFKKELQDIISKESTCRRHEKDLNIDDENWMNDVIIIAEVSKEIKKIVNEYGVFEILSDFKKNKGHSLIDLKGDIDPEVLYDVCYSYYLEMLFNDKFTFKDIINIRKFSMNGTEYLL